MKYPRYENKQIIDADQDTMTYFHEECHKIIDEWEIMQYASFIGVSCALIGLYYSHLRHIGLIGMCVFIGTSVIEEIICWFYAFVKYNNREEQQ